MKSKHAGFTLVELLVVITIIGILAAIVLATLSGAGPQSRDVDRKADLRTLQAAVELYRSDNGRYPEGCNGPGNWSGQQDTDYACSSGNQYITNLAPEYIPVLPRDPKSNGDDSGYVYTVDEEGFVYKIMALNTVESETVDYDHIFSRCGKANSPSEECAMVPSNPTGSWNYNESGSTPSQCNQATQYSNDYALFGGFAAGGEYSGSYRSTPQAQEYFSDIIRCK